MIKHIAYLNDNYMQVKINNNVKEFTSKGILNGQIINKDIFINDFTKKIKILNFWSTVITLYLNKDITEEDNYYYKMIFEELNYIKLNLCSTKYKLSNNSLIINGDKYILYNNSKYIYIDQDYLKDYIDNLKIKSIRIIGSKIINLPHNIKSYYFDDFSHYFLN
jgi:hypothetical protein